MARCPLYALLFAAAATTLTACVSDDTGAPAGADSGTFDLDTGTPPGFDATTQDSGAPLDAADATLPVADASDASHPLDASDSAAPFDAADSAPAADASDAAADAADSAVDAGPTLMKGFTRVGSGNFFTCGVASGVAWCWGYNGDGETGNGNSVTGAYYVPQQVSGLASGVTDLGAGPTFACAIMVGSVYCWGSNASGECGVPLDVDAGGCPSNTCRTPVQVPGVTGAVQLVAGTEGACAVLGSGALTCWGGNGFGELGIGTSDFNAHPPTTVIASGVAQVVAGAGMYCALLTDGTVECWGENNDGALGSTGTNDSPTLVAGLSGVTKIAAGGNTTVCALMTIDGGSQVEFWGNNGWGTFGNGTSDESTHATPTVMTALGPMVDIMFTGDAACGILADGTVQCWGRNGSGELGHDPALDVGTSCANGNECDPNPSSVAGISGVTFIGGAKDETLCAVEADTTLWCWGSGSDGQMGEGMGVAPAQQFTPLPVYAP